MLVGMMGNDDVDSGNGGNVDDAVIDLILACVIFCQMNWTFATSHVQNETCHHSATVIGTELALNCGE